MIPSELVLATANRGKITELRALVDEWGIVDVRSLADFGPVVLPDEAGSTYRENAELKARAVAAATGLPALADDSGLEVDALDGAPGVRSARFAPDDPARVTRLLTALRGVETVRRGARFRCAVVLAWPDGRVVSAEGSCEGRIAAEPQGSGGFGYDPVFIAEEAGRTFAQVTAAEKRALSHRARAMRALGMRLHNIARRGAPC